MKALTLIIVGPYMSFSVPIKFFIGKEFFFVILDELKNRSISSKIQDLIDYKTQDN